MHTKSRPILSRIALTFVAACATVLSAGASAAPLNISDSPLFVQESVAPLNMLVVGRDHKLYYEAYNDHSDLDGDGDLDIGYNPDDIDYYGYFDSFKCYVYNTTQFRFDPNSVTANKQCSGMWSGDFLNYLTMTRIDALRKVLYGGLRSEDDDDTTLERSHVPQDAHSWGKEYSGLSDGYDIRNYTPLALPAAGTRHLFANTTLLNDTNQEPRLRLLLDQTVRIWNWVSIERPVADTRIVTGVSATGGEIRTAVTPTDYFVRVRVCRAGLLEANCQPYPNGYYKPIGLLQEFGENDSMFFGLLSGSYAKNTSGGVLRRAVGSITDEVSTNDGTFLDFNGIIRSLNRLRTTGFGGSYLYSCGSTAAGRPINDGDCQMWGNPIAEMMYESSRYFAGKEAATSAFSIVFGQGEESQLPGGGLPVAAWDDPYEDRPVCSKPFQTVVSDINASYDTDQLPGVDANFGSFSGDLAGLNVSTLGQTIWTDEIGAAGNYFIGQVGASTDGAPTAKTVSSFGNIRGLSPEEPTKRGGYYAASVAHHGFTTDLNPASGEQKLSTFSVALASPLPKIEIPVGGRKITLVPFAKTVGGAFGITATQGNFQPTNQIVDFYIDTLTSTSGRFRVNFEDVEQGNDHDMDAIVVYDYVVNADNTVTVTLNSEYAAGGAYHHMGFVISGTSADGIYLPVRDRDTAAANDPNYFLDTPNVAGELPLTWSQTFSPGSTGGADILKDPLWYAAKWGGFQDGNDNDRPDVAAEWDEDGDGDPDNYFLVTNALTLSQQLRSAFEEIIARVASASSASVNSGSVSSDTRIYQAKFNSGTWTGQLLAFPVNADGSLGAQVWDAASRIPAAGSRKIITVNSNGTGVPFQWASLDATRQAQIDADPTAGAQRLAYLRGDRTNERSASNPGGIFRERPTLLGDIVSSSPLFVGAPFFAFSDTLESAPYSAFKATHATRRPVVYAGANDGMLHAFDGDTGDELLAYVPGAAFGPGAAAGNLRRLANPSYTHKFFVDGAPNMRDVFFNGAWRTVVAGGLNAGGQAVYALNVTNPGSFSEANASNIVLWEFTDRDANGVTGGITGDADLGYTYSQPALIKLTNGKWAAIFGNGYNNTEADGSASSTGNAVLYVVDVETGQRIAKLDTLEGMNDDPLGQGRPNGLATPAVVDLNGDRKVDYVYAGDLFGNMWKFDIRDTDPGQWRVAYGTTAAPEPLFTALGSVDAAAPDTVTRAQPITSRPEVVRGPRGVGMMVLFGTGKYVETTDDQVSAASPEIQTYYGVWDKNSGTATDQVASRTQLLKQQILSEGAVTFGTQTLRVRTSSNFDLIAQSGWYIDLLSPAGYNGERQVSNTTVRGSRVIFTTLIPDSNPCNFGGSSWLMELEALNGSRIDVTPFDLNNDGVFDGGDMATIVVNGANVTVPVSGLQPDVGITPEPGILYGTGATREYLYSPGTTGDIRITVGSTDPRASGRQSWRQIR